MVVIIRFTKQELLLARQIALKLVRQGASGENAEDETEEAEVEHGDEVQNKDANKYQSAVESAEANSSEQKIESSTEPETVQVNVPADQPTDWVQIIKHRIQNGSSFFFVTMKLIACSHRKIDKYWKQFLG